MIPLNLDGFLLSGKAKPVLWRLGGGLYGMGAGSQAKKRNSGAAGG